MNAPAVVAWKEPIERRVLDADMRGVVIVSSVAYGDGAKARNELGWAPTHPDLLDDLLEGSYRKVAAGHSGP